MGSVSNISQKISQYQNSGLNYVGQKLGTPSITRLAINTRADSTVMKIVKLVATITLLPVLALALYDFAQRIWTVIVGKMPQPAPQSVNQQSSSSAPAAAQPSSSAPVAPVDSHVPAAPVQPLVQQVVDQSSQQADEAAAAARQASARAEADAAQAAELAAAREKAAREAEQLARQEQERLAQQAAATATAQLQALQAQQAAQVTAPAANAALAEAANASAAAAEAERLQQEVALDADIVNAALARIDTKTALARDEAVEAQNQAARAEDARKEVEQPAPLSQPQIAAVQAGAVIIADVAPQPSAPAASVEASAAEVSADAETDAAIAALNAELGDFEEPSLTVPADSAAAAPSLEAVMAEEHSETTSFADTSSSQSHTEFYEHKTAGVASDNPEVVEEVSEHKETATVSASKPRRRHYFKHQHTGSGTHAPRNRKVIISASGSVAGKQGSPSNRRKDQ